MASTFGFKSKIFYDHVNLVTRRTIDQSVGGKLRDLNAKESWALLEDLALYANKSWNDPKDFAKPFKAIALPQDVSSTSDRRLIEFENQVQHLIEAHLDLTQPTQVNKVTTSCEIYSGPHNTQNYMEDPEHAFVKYASSRDFDYQEKRLSHLRTQLKQQQDDMIGKINLLWKTISEKLNNTPIPESGLYGFRKYYFNQPYREGGTQKKGIKSPLKLLSLKYLSPTSIIKLNKNPSAPKRIHFVNSIVILSEESEAKQGEPTTNITLEHDYNITKEAKDEGKEVIDEEESKVGTVRKLKNYSKMRKKRKRMKTKPSNLNKISNFVGRVGCLKIFIGIFGYECDFMILEDTTSIIDRHLGEMAFGRPFIDETGLVYNKEKGTVMFKQNDEKITFKMPHTMEIFKQTDLWD
nr:MAK10-like protein [Tanacetum cinerariifolium]